MAERTRLVGVINRAHTLIMNIDQSEGTKVALHRRTWASVVKDYVPLVQAGTISVTPHRVSALEFLVKDMESPETTTHQRLHISTALIAALPGEDDVKPNPPVEP